jgi:ankyrin repeat protein
LPWLCISSFALVSTFDTNYFTIPPRNPLHLAAKGCHLEMAELLIQYGAKVNRIDGSLAPVTPLDYARDSGCAALITLLKSHGGVELGLLD